MKARDVLKRLVALIDNGQVTNAQANAVLNGTSIVSGGKVLGLYRNGMLVASDGRAVTLSVDKIDGLLPDATIDIPVMRKSGGNS